MYLTPISLLHYGMYLAPIRLLRLISVMVVALPRTSLITIEIYHDIKGYTFDFLYNFLVKKCFFHSFSHNVHAKQLTFHHVLWKQCPKSNQNTPNHCTTWTLGNFSRAWIVFHQSNSILPLTLDFAPSSVISW